MHNIDRRELDDSIHSFWLRGMHETTRIEHNFCSLVVGKNSTKTNADGVRRWKNIQVRNRNASKQREREREKGEIWFLHISDTAADEKLFRETTPVSESISMRPVARKKMMIDAAWKNLSSDNRLRFPVTRLKFLSAVVNYGKKIAAERID